MEHCENCSARIKGKRILNLLALPPTLSAFPENVLHRDRESRFIRILPARGKFFISAFPAPFSQSGRRKKRRDGQRNTYGPTEATAGRDRGLLCGRGMVLRCGTLLETDWSRPPFHRGAVEHSFKATRGLWPVCACGRVSPPQMLLGLQTLSDIIYFSS